MVWARCLCLAVLQGGTACRKGMGTGRQILCSAPLMSLRVCPVLIAPPSADAPAEHEAKQLEALGGAAPDRSALFIGLGRAELNRTEFFSERGGLAVTMQERVFRTPGCGGEGPGPQRRRLPRPAACRCGAWPGGQPCCLVPIPKRRLPGCPFSALSRIPSAVQGERSCCREPCCAGGRPPFMLLALPTFPSLPADVLPGEFMLQNLCSLVTAHVLGAQPGSRVLDMCAAPGGKTTAIAQLMGNQGEVRRPRLAGCQGPPALWKGCLPQKSTACCAKIALAARRAGLSLGLPARLGCGIPSRIQVMLCTPCPCPAQVIAFDRSHAKAAEVRRLAESFGLTCVQAYKMDATKAVLQQEPAAQGQQGQPADSEQREQQGGQLPAAAQSVPGASRGRRGGATQPPSEATLRRLERIAAAKRARGLEPSPSPHVAEGKEAITAGFPPNSFDYVLCDAPCSALGLRPR